MTSSTVETSPTMCAIGLPPIVHCQPIDSSALPASTTSALNTSASPPSLTSSTLSTSQALAETLVVSDVRFFILTSSSTTSTCLASKRSSNDNTGEEWYLQAQDLSLLLILLK
uniref:Uncharacterized protein n=1 Tax=Nelumbo nucifera TaxID=4432 RepID=A0A822XSB1_NELNU|nr:TPA_asm: hypothetical protein HUJ06_024753 [Nelumbo nucifera]